MATSPAEDSIIDVLAVFVDVRGFTKWSNSTEVFASIGKFVGRFNGILKKHFPVRPKRARPNPGRPTHYHKPLGDGAMIVREIGTIESAKDAATLLSEVLAAIAKCEEDFKSLCKQFAEQVGQATVFGLGWGIVRGKAIASGGDYLGHNINKAARLCDAARPHGIVVDMADFPRLEPSQFQFYRQERKLSGMENIEAWVTGEVYNQFLTREQIRHAPEVHVAGVCFDPSHKAPRVLIAKRAVTRKLYPGRWEGCGGQLAESESFIEGVKRHFRKEMGIDVTVIEGLHLFYEIKEPSHPLIPGIRFACERNGEQEPASANHTEWKWITKTEVGKMSDDDFVPDLKKHILDMVASYEKLKST